VLHYWSVVFGFTSFSARLLSLVFVALASVVLYLFCDKFLNKKTALIASVLFLVSNDFFFYSHEARAYTMILFLTLTSTYLFFSLLFDPKFWKIIAVGAVNFLIFYTHYLAGLFFVGQVLVSLLYNYHKGFKYYVFSYLLLILLLFHWIPRVVQIISTKSGVSWLLPPVFLDLSNFWITALYGTIGI
jgi:4-amino-4-deoxy-L-arabinose transferase-like glycosyltransferase